MQNTRTICTLCPSLDRLLDYGIKTKAITSIIGARGSGKTQFCLQLAFALQAENDTDVRRTLFIQSHQSFPIRWLAEVSNAQKEYQEFSKSVRNTIFRYCDEGNTFLTMIDKLPELIQRKKITLVILDNVEEHLTSIIPKENICKALQRLFTIAYTLDVAVVITVKRIRNFSTACQNILITKLEEYSKFQLNMSHLYDCIYKVELYKSPVLHFMTMDERDVKIKITPAGIFDAIFVEKSAESPKS